MISSTLLSLVPSSVTECMSSISLPMLLIGILGIAVVSYFVYKKFFGAKEGVVEEKQIFVQEQVYEEEQEENRPPPLQPDTPQQQEENSQA